MTEYNPREFWPALYHSGYPFNVPPKQMEEEMELLKKIIPKDIKSVLELGAGEGRFTKVLYEVLDIQRYVGVELIPERAEKLGKNIAKFGGHQTIVNSLYQDVKFSERFDLVFGSHILLHIPPNEIESVVEKMARETNKHIINIDYFEESLVPSQKLAHYNFLYNYPKLFSDAGLGVTRHKVDDWVSIFHSVKP